MLNNPFGVAAYYLLRTDWGWKLLSQEEKQIILDINLVGNVERVDYKNPDLYGAERMEGGQNWDNYSIENQGLRGETIASVLRKHQPANVLEIGPGAGFHTRQIATFNSVSNLTLVDLGAAFLEYLKPRLDDLTSVKPGFDYTLIVKEAQQLVSEGITYDSIFLISTVHHIPNRIDLFQSLANLVRPGGIVACFEPSHYLERILRLTKRFKTHGFLKKSNYMDRTNLKTHHMCTYGEFKKICKSTRAFEIDDAWYVPSTKLGALGKISKRWASTEMSITLRRL